MMQTLHSAVIDRDTHFLHTIVRKDLLTSVMATLPEQWWSWQDADWRYLLETLDEADVARTGSPLRGLSLSIMYTSHSWVDHVQKQQLWNTYGRAVLQFTETLAVKECIVSPLVVAHFTEMEFISRDWATWWNLLIWNKTVKFDVLQLPLYSSFFADASRLYMECALHYPDSVYEHPYLLNWLKDIPAVHYRVPPCRSLGLVLQVVEPLNDEEKRLHDMGTVIGVEALQIHTTTFSDEVPLFVL